MLFEDFDFDLLDDPSFKEDSVREELIAPLLKALGYSASPPHRIRRSVSLTHPHVYIGSKKHSITITPDYLVEKDGEKFFILDAKAPNEDIRRGKNVEQAYSYAIHPNIRVQHYALCNGHDFVLYDVSSEDYVLYFKLKDISAHIDYLSHLIGAKVSMNRLDFRPDWGFHLASTGRAVTTDGKKYAQIHASTNFHFVGKVSDELCTLHCILTDEEGREYLGTFDFSPSLLQEFFEHIEPKELKSTISPYLKNQPYHWYGGENIRGKISIMAEVGDGAYDNGNEKYFPLKVIKFLPSI